MAGTSVLRRGGVPLAAACLATAGLAGAGLAGAAPAVAGPAQPGRAPLHGTRPAQTRNAVERGRTPGGTPVRLRVWLAYRDPAQVRALAAAVSDPTSPLYGHYLSPAQFDSRFGPTPAMSAAVAGWLRQAGLHVDAVPGDSRYVEASGTVAQAEAAFAVPLEDYAVRGTTVRAPAGDPSVPSDLSGDVLTVTGLDTADHMLRPAAPRPEPPPPAFVNAPPYSTDYGALPAAYEADGTTALPSFDGHVLPYPVRGYTPVQLRGAYGVTATGLTGAGTTVAITDAYESGTIVADANQYAANHDPSAPALVAGESFTQSLPRAFTDQQRCGAGGWPVEETLDVEAVHAIAPAAHIAYFAAANCNDPAFIDALQRAVEDPAVDVVSNSWAGLESQETAGVIGEYEQVFQQGIIEGKTFSFSSGDNGDELAATGSVQVDYPASDPYVTAAGGTSVAIVHDALIGQTGWGTQKAALLTDPSGTPTGWGTPGFIYGSGGGTSALFAQPGYQQGAVAGPRRGVPDISMDADPTTGMLVGETQTFPRSGPGGGHGHGGTVAYGEYRIGGTSLASPLLAGMLTLADQAALASGHETIAQANVLLYQVAADHGAGIVDVLAQGQDGTMPDVGNVRVDYANYVDASAGTVYSVRTFGQDSSLSLGPGWDNVTGLGTLDGSILATLAGLAPQPG